MSSPPSVGHEVERHVGSPTPAWTRTAGLRAEWVGLLLGLAAAGSGLISPIAAVGVRPWHVFVGLAAILAITSIPPRDLLASRIRAIDILTVLFVLVVLGIEITNSLELNYEIDFVAVFSPLFYFVAYLSARASVRNYADALQFLRLFVAPVIFVTPLAVGQALGIPAVTNFVLAMAPGEGAIRRLEESSFTRSTGLVGHWTGFGGYLLIIVAASLAILIITASATAPNATVPRPLAIRVRRYAVLVLALAVVSLVTTLTFSVVLTAAAAVVICARAAGFRHQVIWLFAAVGVIGSTVFGALVEARLDQQFSERVRTPPGLPDWLPGTLLYRVRIWTDETIPMINDRPTTGWGTGVFGAVYSGTEPGRVYPMQLAWHSPESQWFGTAITYGLVGLLAQIALLVAVCVLLARACRKRHAQFVALPMMVIFVGAVLASATVPIFTNRGFPAAFWPVLGVVAALQVHAAAKDSQAPPSAARS